MLERFRLHLERRQQHLTLVAGLGNPGQRYHMNRHNVGFQIVDVFAANHDLSFSKRQHNTALAQGVVGQHRVLLAKPQTYMNDSGRALQRLISYYKIDLQDVLVIYDDLDLPTGKLRLRPSGGAGGHNGLKSIIQQLGSDQFARLRVGIDRPPGRMNPADYVLQNFSSREEELLLQARDRACQAIESWLVEGIETAMNLFN